jgi:DNA-binding CsgD family transcriptional regulator
MGFSDMLSDCTVPVCAREEKIVAENGTQLQPDSFDVEGEVQDFKSEFDESKIGAALFDPTCKIRAINKTLAEMNRRSVEAHTGKTLGEIVNKKCCEASSIIPKVFESGLPAHVEINAKLATRLDEGTWSVSFLPVKDVAGRVRLVRALVVETLHQKWLAELLRTLLTNLLQVRDKVSWAYLSSQTRKEPVDPAHLVRVAELSEHCVQALQRFALQASEQFPLVLAEEESNQPLLPFANRHINTTSEGSHPPTDELSESKLTPRQLEVVRLLAASKTNKEVASILSIKETTVQTYRTRIMFKLRVHSITEVVRFAVRTKLLDP